jgi:hypothetical protein
MNKNIKALSSVLLAASMALRAAQAPPLRNRP